MAGAAKEGRNVLDQSEILGGAFDEDILSDIERRLSEDGGGLKGPKAGDKVELDKADLVFEGMDEPAPEPPPAPGKEPAKEIEIDLGGGEAKPKAEKTGGKKPGLKLKLVLIAAGAVLLILASLGIGIMFGTNEPDTGKEEPKLEPWKFAGAVPALGDALRLQLDPFIIPLQVSENGNLLHVTVTLEASAEEYRDLLAESLILCRDVVYRVLRARKAKEINSERARSLLASQIKAEINQALGDAVVFDVRFDKFLVTG